MDNKLELKVERSGSVFVCEYGYARFDATESGFEMYDFQFFIDMNGSAQRYGNHLTRMDIARREDRIVVARQLLRAHDYASQQRSDYTPCNPEEGLEEVLAGITEAFCPAQSSTPPRLWNLEE